MYEIRFHGRGGQGSVMAAQALATAAFCEGQYAAAFPFFGAERRGAPVLAYARIDSQKIRKRVRIEEPDFVVVLDDKLIDQLDVLHGLKEDGTAILNSSKEPRDVKLSRSVRMATVDATSVALKLLGVPITNTAMLGAFSKATGLISIQSIEEGIVSVFGARLGEEAAKRNASAAREAHERTKLVFCSGGKTYEEEREWLPPYSELPLGLSTRYARVGSISMGPGSAVQNKTGSWRTFTPKLNEEKCTNCLICWIYCPDSCILRKPDVIYIDYDYCKGCGICADVCPLHAIEMVRAEEAMVVEV